MNNAIHSISRRSNDGIIQNHNKSNKMAIMLQQIAAVQQIE